MDFHTLARERFSVLHYERRDVPKELVRVILDAALAAPMACNRQPQRILVIDNNECPPGSAVRCPVLFMFRWLF